MKHVIAVTNLDDRLKVTRAVHKRYLLKALEQTNLKVLQNKINQVTVYEDNMVVHTITVVTVPILCNLEPLEEMCGPNTKFTLSSLMEAVDQLKGRLQSLIQNPDRSRTKRSALENIVNRVTE